MPTGLAPGAGETGAAAADGDGAAGGGADTDKAAPPANVPAYLGPPVICAAVSGVVFLVIAIVLLATSSESSKTTPDYCWNFTRVRPDQNCSALTESETETEEQCQIASGFWTTHTGVDHYYKGAQTSGGCQNPTHCYLDTARQEFRWNPTLGCSSGHQNTADTVYRICRGGSLSPGTCAYYGDEEKEGTWRFGEVPRFDPDKNSAQRNAGSVILMVSGVLLSASLLCIIAPAGARSQVVRPSLPPPSGA